jgi:hypothetical protein
MIPPSAMKNLIVILVSAILLPQLAQAAPALNGSQWCMERVLPNPSGEEVVVTEQIRFLSHGVFTNSIFSSEGHLIRLITGLWTMSGAKLTLEIDGNSLTSEIQVEEEGAKLRLLDPISQQNSFASACE